MFVSLLCEFKAMFNHLKSKWKNSPPLKAMKFVNTFRRLTIVELVEIVESPWRRMPECMLFGGLSRRITNP